MGEDERGELSILDDATYAVVLKFSELGNAAFEAHDFAGAIEHWTAAFNLIPDPKRNYEASTWICTSIGDAYFQLGEYQKGLPLLEYAVRCPGGLGNPFVHLRLGQFQLELGNENVAADDLARAYMGGGREIFEGEDEKYWVFIRAKLKL
ncbi:MAG: hypothetical protein L6R28_08690 [Planctomycetes bacterium]|nr:hypothetical protein [Planctomycetota bacterium]